MNRYDSFKDSGVEWIGEIPSGWDIGKLKHLCEENLRSLSNSTDPNYELNYIEISDVNSEGVIGVSTPYIFSESPSRCRRIVQKGDVIVSTVRTYLKSIGHIENEVQDLICSTGFSVLTPKGKFISKYLFYLLRTDWFISKVISKSEGVSYPSIQSEKLMNIDVLYCGISEQQQMVTFLDTKTSLIDSLISKTQQKIDLLKEKRLKLVEDVILNSNTKRVRLGYVVDLVKRPIDRENNETYTKIGMYNWGRGIFKYPSELGSDLGDSTFNYIKEGDLLLSGQFSWEGSVSLVEQEQDNCISSHRFHILNGIEGKILNEYLWSYFTSQEGHFLLNENSPGSAGRNRPLNIGKLLKEKIPVPEMEIQMEIQRLVIETNNYEKYSKRRTELLKEYRQSLISEVVTGKIRVCEEDNSLSLNPHTV